MVGFDTTFLTWLFVRTAKHRVPNAKERVEYLISELSGRGDQIVIPTPALSELLIKTGVATSKILDEIKGNPRFIIAPFDLLAAIELALFSDATLSKADKRQGSTAIWSKVKFDRQIVAICKVLRTSCIYSDDGDVKATGKREGMPVYGVEDIHFPDKLGAEETFRLTSPPSRNT